MPCSAKRTEGGPMPVPVRGLFEAHLAVRDPVRSSAFYRDILGLELAYDAPDVGATFFWIGGPGKGMLGLWTMGSTPMSVSLHVAFEVALPRAPGRARCPPCAWRHPTVVLRAGGGRTERHRLDARGGGLLSGPGRASARVLDDARRGTATRPRHRCLVGLAGACGGFRARLTPRPGCGPPKAGTASGSDRPGEDEARPS